MKMLYAKLAAAGIKNNRQFYLPYLLTGILSVTMFYLLPAMQDNPGLSSLGGGASDIRMILTLGVVVVGVFVSIFLFYTNSFIIRRRKKELGLYNILGMEKKHIAKVLFLETIFTIVVTTAGGLAFGIAFHKLMEMILYRVTGLDGNIPFYVSATGCANTLKLFAVIYGAAFLYNMMQIRLANPVELLHSSNTGEREPKTKVLTAVVGAVCMGAGYYIAVTTADSIEAIQNFFVAVLLVIVGTYCLFTAGSIAVLKLLRKNKKFYYRTKHFTTVSGMIYRMKQNAVGLANICILSTMVMVTVSTTVCLYLGEENMLESRYPSEISIVSYYSGVPEQETQVQEMAETSLKESGRVIMNASGYMGMSLAGRRDGNVLSAIFTGAADDYDYTDMIMIYLTSKEDYERKTGQTLAELADGEAAVAAVPAVEESSIIFEGREYAIKEYCELPAGEEEDFMLQQQGACYLILPDRETLGEVYTLVAENWNSDRVSPSIRYEIALDIDGSKEEKLAAENAMIQRLSDWENGDAPKEDVFEYNYIETREQNRSSFYSLYGALFFLGLFLGSLFLMVTVVIIFYKQISEGYEDKERYAIMEKVGMSNDEVKRAIRSQVLMVFFLPLGTAVVHVCAAFPMMRMLLGCFNFTNVLLFVGCVAGTVLVFAVIYLAVFVLTSHSYYKIVGNQV